MGTAYGISGCTGQFAIQDTLTNSSGLTAGEAGLAADVYSDTGTTKATNGGAVAQWNDISGANNHAVQATSGNRPVYRQIDGAGCNSSIGGVQFDGAARYLTMPSGVGIGNGSPTNEGTIIVAMSLPTVGSATFPANSGGFPLGIGGVGLWYNGTSIPTWYNGSETPFTTPTLWSPLHPSVFALRFKSGESRFYWGTKYSEAMGSNLISSSLTGGTLGGKNADFFLNCILHEVIIFNQAVSDSNMSFLLQTVQDRVCPEYDNTNHVVFFGDSRTQGYDSTLSSNYVSTRSWPAKFLRAVGGKVKADVIAKVGDTVSAQQTKVTSAIGTANGINNAKWTNHYWIGEVGVNDILAGDDAFTIYVKLTNLWAYMLAHGATKVFALTVAPASSLTGGQETVRQTLNGLIKATSISNVTIIDNAADARLALTGYPDSDGLHWLEPGYSVYAQNVATAYRAVVAGTGGGLGTTKNIGSGVLGL